MPTRPLLRPFDVFPDEGIKVGRLLAAYGELEVDLLNCVAIATTTDIALKGIYRHRSGTKRINNAERLGTPHYTRYDLASEWVEAIGEMRNSGLAPVWWRGEDFHSRYLI